MSTATPKKKVPGKIQSGRNHKHICTANTNCPPEIALSKGEEKNSEHPKEKKQKKTISPKKGQIAPPSQNPYHTRGGEYKGEK